MPDPKADAIRCDVPGCSMLATYRTDGKEKDTHVQRVGKTNLDGTIVEPSRDQVMNRPSIPNLNVCDTHRNWSHSEDAKEFAAGSTYRARKG